jgi:transposase
MWQATTGKANAADFDQVLALIAAQESEYASLLASWTEADFRGSIELFGRTQTRAAWLLELVLNGCAAYRTQLFCYLKSCGREELSTANLWQGVDAAVPA